MRLIHLACIVLLVAFCRAQDSSEEQATTVDPVGADQAEEEQPDLEESTTESEDGDEYADMDQPNIEQVEFDDRPVNFPDEDHPDVDVPPPPPVPEKKECRYDLQGSSGTFVSDNFPEEYNSETNCTWNITVPENERVQLTFHILNVEHNFQCRYDWVKVFDSNGTLLKHVCGYLQQDLVLTSTNNSLSLWFYSDVTINTAGFLASWKSVPMPEDSSGEEENTEQPDQVQKGYVLSFPQSFTVAEDAVKETICLQLFNVQSDGKVKLSLMAPNEIIANNASVVMEVDHTGGDGGIHCHEMGLPGDFEKKWAVVGISADFPQDNYKILSYKSVRIIKATPLALIQTDKYDYRPKQLVNIRIMLVNEQLKPSKLDVVKEMWLTDPSDARVAQWTDVDLNKAMAQVSYQLSEEPALGKWKITAKFGEEDTEKTADFTVSESVLPKYEVTFDGPEFVLRDSVEETFKVCAKYTHGSGVKGRANASITVTYKDGPYWRAPTRTRAVNNLVDLDKTGCGEVTLNRTDIEHLTEKSAKLNAVVVVKEAATGEKQNTTWKGEVKFTPFELTFGSSSKAHIVGGGFPYVGRIRAQEHGTSKSVANVKLEICVRLYTSLHEMRNYVSSNSHLFYNYKQRDFYALSKKLATIQFKEKCEEKYTGEDGSVDFSVPLSGELVPTNVTTLMIDVVAVDHEANKTTGMKQPKANHDIALTHTNATTAFTIHAVDGKGFECEENTVDVFVSSQPSSDIELTYYLSSGGAIMDSGTETVASGQEDFTSDYTGGAHIIHIVDEQDTPNNLLAKHTLKFTRPFEDEGRVSGKFKLLAFIRDEAMGETLASSQEFDAKVCTPQPKLSWSSPKLNPGTQVSLNFNGEPGALCGYSVVDKSVDLVPNANKVTTKRLQDLKEAIVKRRVVNDKVKGDCQDAHLLFKAFESLGLFVLSDNLVESTSCDNLVDATNQKDPSIRYRPVFAQEAFDVRSDFEYDDAVPLQAQAFAAEAPPPARRPGPPQAISFNKSPASGDGAAQASEVQEVKENTVELRNYFPETWLFDVADLDTEGNFQLEVMTPHTITKWVAETVCSSENTGLSVSDKASLLVTQDFFVDLRLPYSVKRGEIMPLNVSVFNTVEQRKLPIRLTVQDSESYKLDRSTSQLCLEPEDSQTEKFSLKAKELHEVNITVEAMISDADNDVACDAAGNAAGYTDIIQKPILVKPEGYPVEKVDSEFACRNEEDTDPIELKSLELPPEDKLVEGSQRAWVTATGDIMAPALANLERLINVPYGCGEQNMISMVPNIYVVDYLQGTGQSKPELVAKAKKYMKIGYDRQNERYRHSDGSFSVWGPKDNEPEGGSMWLTAFVVKAFSQAAKHIPVNERQLEESIEWIVRHKKPDGCFKDQGFVHHQDLRGSDHSLTASILVTLLEADMQFGKVLSASPRAKLSENIADATKCLLNNITDDTELYTKSLAAYALTLKDDEPKKSNQLMNQLLEVAQTDKPGKLYWHSNISTPIDARDVEITAYNVLTLTLQNKLPEALQAIRWLATQRNARGGFKSTQDTMMALQAMSQYSLKVRSRPTDVDITVTTGGEDYGFHVDDTNLLLYQKQKVALNEQDSKVKVAVSGQGCFMVQTILRYNVQQPPNVQSFSMTVEQDHDNNIQVCAVYLGPKEKTNMVVVEMELLSGFVADESSLENLLTIKSKMPVKKYEYDEKENNVVLYFNLIPKKINCVDFSVFRKIKVDKLKPAIAKIYDYYNQEDLFTTEYNIDETA